MFDRARHDDLRGIRGSEAILADALEILRRVWGYQNFRGKQFEAIENILKGGDTLVLFPTGKGKSLCYQLPALYLEGTAVVVSPLVALMRDQVEELRSLGIAAEALFSGQSGEEQAAVRSQLSRGELKLLYVTPERIVLPSFTTMFGQQKVSLIAVDESHCISVWGNNFRKDYLELGRLKDLFSAVPVVALTATADPHTQRDILDKLNLDDPKVFIDSFDRPNISYEIVERTNAKAQLIEFLRRHEGESGIVYCLSRKKVEETVLWLNDRGVKARHYHAGLDPSEKAANQDAFRLEEGLCLVATVAFGMGINKPNVRYVAHLDLPSSVESYYQETGRAGRDGLPSEAFMTYGMQDIVQRQRMIEMGESSEQVKRVERAKLSALVGICETAGCRRQAVLGHFGEKYSGNCGNCDNCLRPVATFDGTDMAVKALAAIYRTGERFGTGHVIDVLTGKETEKTKRFGHTELAVFGAGRDVDARTWQSVYRQLLALGFIRIEHDDFGAMKLEPSCRGVFRKETEVILRRDLVVRRSKGVSNAVAGSAARQRGGLSDADYSLFESLRLERLRIAKEQGVAPYVIFPDTTLISFATSRPKSRSAMLGVPGVGQVKLERYGDIFLSIIREIG
ncbi:DNA helicase RecQ [Sinorhizobium fredii]|uniref:DNA helicase RecQ n=1 Tax=Rhizobium fredii TaxID=380 RepID=UPI003CE54E0D